MPKGDENGAFSVAGKLALKVDVAQLVGKTVVWALHSVAPYKLIEYRVSIKPCSPVAKLYGALFRGYSI